MVRQGHEKILTRKKEDTMLTRMFRFLKEEEGATAVEYGLMVALIAMAIIITVALVGTNLNTLFSGVATNLVNPGGGGGGGS